MILKNINELVSNKCNRNISYEINILDSMIKSIISFIGLNKLCDDILYMAESNMITFYSSEYGIIATTIIDNPRETFQYHCKHDMIPEISTQSVSRFEYSWGYITSLVEQIDKQVKIITNMYYDQFKKSEPESEKTHDVESNIEMKYFIMNDPHLFIKICDIEYMHPTNENSNVYIIGMKSGNEIRVIRDVGLTLFDLIRTNYS